MFSYKQITTFAYDTKDFNFLVNSCEENESLFDNTLRHMWKQAEEIKAFRYILNIRESKTLKGKYRFLVQLNPDRAQCRRAPESITSTLQSFSFLGFNFTKLTRQEILFDVGNGDANDIIAINASPLEQCHCLLLTERFKYLPQIMTEYSLHKVIELCLLSNLWSLRAAFNGLCAHASVNHLHWHLYYLKYEMLLEYIDLCSYISGIYLLVDYPAKGFCLKFSDFKNIKDFVSRTFVVVNHLQLRQMAYNVYITRAKSKSNDELYNDIRIYIWVRKPLIGVKDTIAFIPGVCELFGHLSIKDENAYNSLTEDNVNNVLYNITEEYFSLIKDELKIILEK
ncbi:PREDICTED: GDP-D-glucose phosphorylase 1 [Vollenhovia emeryi]|uniref:GDP-D-glucose phosphorylase 1 n=1 Tax=Vollenhovia emeryi TaxID=411798 RepID=UPI0005F3F67B|nr:PREDICTED: GDP-D-glucose phosphorylase 1 [Vollenhovia emeryi]XP_011859756.1 PREDICTED: GDP-D-glucose phosphorylase 1 [Vollenhovia emeryi]XP_011859757.1 PREDICTED: GDP-D-glucose phosphorylase 1 [Vollenhovia emeryi]